MEQVSARTKHILSLARLPEVTGIPPKARNTNMEDSETDVKTSDDLEEYDPVSNWVVEVEPEILKKSFCHQRVLRNETINSEKVSCMPDTKEQKSDMSEWTSLSSVTGKYVCPNTGRNIKKLKFEEPESLNNNMTDTTNIPIPLIIVPSKESVSNVVIKSHWDLPIILENAYFIPENNEFKTAKETYISHDKETESHNLNFCSNPFSNESTSLEEGKIENYGLTDDPLELTQMPNSYTPIVPKKINIISQHILREKDPEPKINALDQIEADSNLVNVLLNNSDESHCISEENLTKTKVENSNNGLMQASILSSGLTLHQDIPKLDKSGSEKQSPCQFDLSSSYNSSQDVMNDYDGENDSGESTSLEQEKTENYGLTDEPLEVQLPRSYTTILPKKNNIISQRILKEKNPEPKINALDQVEADRNYFINEVLNTSDENTCISEGNFTKTKIENGSIGLTQASILSSQLTGLALPQVIQKMDKSGSKSKSCQFDLSTSNNSSQDANNDYDGNNDSGEEEIERTHKKHYKDKKTFCFFCEKDVSHFSRHLNTWHPNEIEVQRIESYKKKSKERRQALSELAKRGNYVKNRSTSQLRAVKRVEPGMQTCVNDFLPCSYCLGFYKKKSLYRHTKTCHSKPESTQGKRQQSQSKGQTALLLGKFKHDQLLDTELFPRMRADDVSLIAKKDPLICSYAFSYMKGRKSKGNLDFVRTSVRNLARLLKLSKEADNNNIKSLIDLLRPTFFKKIISAVNIIGGYNEKNDVYESPTVALNFGTLLKKCCDLANIQLLQEPDTGARRKEIKILKTLIESQWANEVSAQASLNLNSKKWNKEELLPLTSDLKKLKDYLETKAKKAFETLKQNETDNVAYNSLKEILYCLIILMNRRRPAEVAQIKVETYKSINLDLRENEFEGCLTETEKILLNSCCRMVIRGKRGRGVPVLLTQDMRQHFDILIKVRDHFIKDNAYIFHTTGKNFVDGTKVLFKYAQMCGIQNPRSISATKLRKHLATVTQLLQFSESDLEQLSKFMGHTLQTHCNFYRLSDSTYQTAKISKLLLLATEGGLEKYKGQDLNNINIELNPIVEDCEIEDIIIEEIPDESSLTLNDNLTQDLKEKTDPKKKTCAKQSWSVEQKSIIAKYFAAHIKKKQSPKQSEVAIFQGEYPEMFKERKWTSIKAVVYNFYANKLIIPIKL